MKDKFTLEKAVNGKMSDTDGYIQIIRRKPKDSPYVVINLGDSNYHFIKDQDLVLFAKNILRAMKTQQP